MIEIYLNGERREVQVETTLAQLLDVCNLPSRRVAVELNKDVVRRDAWESTRLSNQDRVEVVHFVGGG
ncbi:MAG: sulfur carrier protein ThiS [Acidobacteria bacterium]|nr:sulfur carrier protein ThiS [Acidobacteriota bacterium]MCA1608152.1 sulfur carrier protein ThiS [Acidobacteriota bacterium]